MTDTMPTSYNRGGLWAVSNELRHLWGMPQQTAQDLPIVIVPQPVRRLGHPTSAHTCTTCEHGTRPAVKATSTKPAPTASSARPAAKASTPKPAARAKPSCWPRRHRRGELLPTVRRAGPTTDELRRPSQLRPAVPKHLTVPPDGAGRKKPSGTGPPRPPPGLPDRHPAEDLTSESALDTASRPTSLSPPERGSRARKGGPHT